MSNITEQELQEKKKLLIGTIIAHIQAETEEEKLTLAIQGGELTKWFVERNLVSKLIICFEEAYRMLEIKVQDQEEE